MLIILCFVDCHRNWAIVILVISGVLSGPQPNGYLSSHADLSPRFSGTLMGITNTIATIPGFVSPAITGALTDGNVSLSFSNLMIKFIILNKQIANSMGLARSFHLGIRDYWPHDYILHLEN